MSKDFKKKGPFIPSNSEKDQRTSEKRQTLKKISLHTRPSYCITDSLSHVETNILFTFTVRNVGRGSGVRVDVARTQQTRGFTDVRLEGTRRTRETRLQPRLRHEPSFTHRCKVKWIKWKFSPTAYLWLGRVCF